LAQDPTSAAARQDVTARGQALAESFRSLSTDLRAIQRDTDLVARDVVEEINALIGTIAELNQSIGGALDQESKSYFRDEQQRSLDQLAELVDIATMAREDGGIDVTFGNGRSLVIGMNPHDLVISSGPSGLLVIQSDGATVTSEITSGKLGGALHVRDVLVPDYLTRLDTIAFEVVEEVNTLHGAGFDLDGNGAGLFFSAIGATSGAAAAMTVDPALVANGRLIAAGGTATPGDNQTARSLADLRDGLVLDAGLSTLHDGFASFVRKVAGDADGAQTDRATARGYVTQMRNLRDAASGVSLDEEAVMMVKFQRAFEANARFFAVIDELSELILRTLGA
jgi:flagellar hook-associated protein 1 FlgK